MWCATSNETQRCFSPADLKEDPRFLVLLFLFHFDIADIRRGFSSSHHLHLFASLYYLLNAYDLRNRPMRACSKGANLHILLPQPFLQCLPSQALQVQINSANAHIQLDHHDSDKPFGRNEQSLVEDVCHDQFEKWRTYKQQQQQ
jgi:hypothetical protein